MTRLGRILFLSNSYPTTVSGVTTVVSNLLTWLNTKYEVAVICPNTHARYSKRIIDNITHYFLPSYPTLIRKDVRFITPNPIQMQKAFQDYQPDIIHLHDPSPASIVLKDIAVKAGLPVLFSHHFTPQMVLGYLPESLKNAAQNNDNLTNAILQLTCKMYEGATRIIVPTHTVKSALTPFTPIPISVISSGVDYHLFQKPNPAKIKMIAQKYHLPSHPFVLYLGRIDPDKNIHVLLEAWAQVYRYFPDTKLVIAGTGGSVSKLKKLTLELGIEDTLKWVGMVKASDLPPFFTNPFAKIFVIPSPIESQSIVTLMAIAASLPVVAAGMGALPEIVFPGKTGYLCDYANPAIFADKISFLLHHPEIATAYGREGSKIAKKHDFPHVIGKYLDLYDQIISREK